MQTAVGWRGPMANGRPQSTPLHPSNLCRHVGWHYRIGVRAAARGRPRKDSMSGEPGDAPKRKPEPRTGVRKRGPKPTTSGDHLQLLDPELLEEFKQIAAAEEAIRQEQPVDDEADPARFSFHKSLMNAASRGLPEQAEAVLADLDAAGLPPGPRAYHALVFSHMTAKSPDGALAAARTAVEKGLTLLPETFVILIFSVLNHNQEPDVETAQQVLQSMEVQEEGAGREKGGQLGWLMLCKELFRKGFISEAMQSVKRGYDAKGYEGDPELVAYVVEQLARAGLKERAYEEVQGLRERGYAPGPQQYNPLIKAEAATGDWERAANMLTDMSGGDWSPPDLTSYAALLEGMVLSVDPETGLPQGTAAADTDRFEDEDGLQRSFQSGQKPVSTLPEQFTYVTDTLMQGVRPDARCHAAMCSGYIKIGAADEALMQFQSMLNAGGTTRLLSNKKLSALLTMLVEDDRPVDLLNVLKGLLSSNQDLPQAARQPLDHVTEGTTLVSAWLPNHFEYMSAHPDDGSGQGPGGSASLSLRAIFDQSRETKMTEDGIPISVLSGCVVEEDGSGVWVKTSRMTMAQLAAELTEAQIAIPEKAKRTELAALVKERRASLPSNLVEMQKHLESKRKVDAEALERKMGIPAEEPKTKKKQGRGKGDTSLANVFYFVEGRLEEVLLMKSQVKGKGGVTVERSTSDPYSMGDDDSDRPPADDDNDDLGEILKAGVDEGVSDIIMADDLPPDEEGDVGPESDSSQQADSFELMIDQLEASRLNKTAGMRVAFDILHSFEMLGGTPTGPDYETLVAGAVAENNPDVALELSDRLPSMLSMGYAQDEVRALYEQLARVCFNTLRTASADLVMEKAEDCGLQFDDGMYAMLRTALGGRPRHKDVAVKEVQSLTEDASTADLLTKDDVTEPLDEEGGAAGQVVAAPGGGEDDEDQWVYGRRPGAADAVLGDKAEPGAQPEWVEEQAAGSEVAKPHWGLGATFSALADEPDTGLSAIDIMELYEDSKIVMTPLEADDEAEEGEAGDSDSDVVSLGGGVSISMEQLGALQAAVEQGLSGKEALLQAGLIQAADVEGISELLEVEEEAEGELDEYEEQVLANLKELFTDDVMRQVDELDESEDESQQAAVQEMLNPLFAEFLSRGLDDETMSRLEAELDQALMDESRYRDAAREFFIEQAQKSGIDADDVLPAYDAALPLDQVAAEGDPGMEAILAKLSSALDAEEMEELIAEGETKGGKKLRL